MRGKEGASIAIRHLRVDRSQLSIYNTGLLSWPSRMTCISSPAPSPSQAHAHVICHPAKSKPTIILHAVSEVKSVNSSCFYGTLPYLTQQSAPLVQIVHDSQHRAALLVQNVHDSRS